MTLVMLGRGAIPALGTGAGVPEAPRHRFKTWVSCHPDEG